MDIDARLSVASSTSDLTPSHSRSSSDESNESSPGTSVESTRTSSRCSSSQSSFAASPESPFNIVGLVLDDLIEEPIETDESANEIPVTDSSEDQYCLCDEILCEHQKTSLDPSAVSAPISPSWNMSGHRASGDGRARLSRAERRASDETSADNQSIRRSRNWIPRTGRWRERKPSTAISGVQSAPSSRSPSVTRPSVAYSLASYFEPYQTCNSSDPLTSWTEVPRVPQSRQDPVDRKALSSTPLLPPISPELQREVEEPVQSPLQSPSVAGLSSTWYLDNSPSSPPATSGICSPSFSDRPSFASSNTEHSSSEMAVSSMFGEWDPWALKLGHANFNILPEPYLPSFCNADTCNSLYEDWEAARLEYMRHAARICEHYGRTSSVYKLTSRKWEEIDSQWRSNFAKARASAEANGEMLNLEGLPETAPLCKWPSLSDPHNPEKFPSIGEADIVGPMEQIAKIPQHSSKKAILRIFTGPGSLLRKV